MEHVVFEWNEWRYQVDLPARGRIIKLPNGTLLEITEWESTQPRLIEYHFDPDFEEGSPAKFDCEAELLSTG